MNILVLGGGGREHALVWALSENPKCDRIWCAPGNAGIAALAACVALDGEDSAAVIAFCRAQKVDLVVIGPEAPLVAGVADDLRAAGIAAFGPGKEAARLEASKSFTKEICAACNAPTAASAEFEDAALAKAYVTAQGAPIVVKADGLAAGKGVTVAMTVAEAQSAIDAMIGGAFGQAGARVVIEDYLEGEEASLFVLCDGKTAQVLGTAQDHKRAFDSDQGPNTGGMGAYSPAPVLDAEVTARAMAQIVEPTLAELARRGTPYQGVLYVGLMIKDGMPKLIEYNVRLGDPECQVLMLRLGGQMLDLIHACVEGRLDDIAPLYADDHAITVVMAAKGYPGAIEKGTRIGPLPAPTSDEILFHAGTASDAQGLLANGGRVLNVTSRATSLRAARDKAYRMVGAIDWPEGFCRRDIGWRALDD